MALDVLLNTVVFVFSAAVPLAIIILVIRAIFKNIDQRKKQKVVRERLADAES